MPVLWINFVMRSRDSRVVPHRRTTDISLGASAAHHSAVASESDDHGTQRCQRIKLGGAAAVTSAMGSSTGQDPYLLRDRALRSGRWEKWKASS